MRHSIDILAATPGDYPSIKAIYSEGISTGNATFATVCEIPGAKKWFKEKIQNSIFKAVDRSGSTVGWCSLSPYKDTCSYSGVAEVSVYVGHHYQNMGIGSLLLQRLINFAENNNIWALQAGIFPENTASISLHRRHNFKIIGMRENIGKLNGQWRNVVLLERRSAKIF